MSLSTTGANLVLGGLPSTVYLSVHTGNPGTTGASEATGYTRPSLTLAAASGGSRANSNATSFNFTAANTVTYFGYWDAASAGNFILGGALSSSQTYASGNTATVAAGAFTTTAS